MRACPRLPEGAARRAGRGFACVRRRRAPAVSSRCRTSSLIFFSSSSFFLSSCSSRSERPWRRRGGRRRGGGGVGACARQRGWRALRGAARRCAALRGAATVGRAAPPRPGRRRARRPARGAPPPRAGPPGWGGVHAGRAARVLGPPAHLHRVDGRVARVAAAGGGRAGLLAPAKEAGKHGAGLGGCATTGAGGAITAAWGAVRGPGSRGGALNSVEPGWRRAGGKRAAPRELGGRTPPSAPASPWIQSRLVAAA